MNYKNWKRRDSIANWTNYLSEHKPTVAYSVLSSLVAPLKSDNGKILPFFDRSVAQKAIERFEQQYKNNASIPSFEKIYAGCMREKYIDPNSEMQWFVFPSRKKDPVDFDERTEQLRAVSSKLWCSKFHPEETLENHDIHVLVVNGKTKVGIKCADGKIEEIMNSNNHNHKFPLDCLEEIDEYMNKNFPPQPEFENTMQDAYMARAEARGLKAHIENCDLANEPISVLSKIGISVKQCDTSGKYILSRYNQPGWFYSFEDIGVDEKIFADILRNTVEIEGYADFSDSRLNDLSSLVKMGGGKFYNSNIVKLDALEEIVHNVCLIGCEIKEVPVLKKLGGQATVGFDTTFDGNNIDKINAYLKNKKGLF